MSLYLRLVVGPVVVCDVTLFETVPQQPDEEPPPQLNGGTGTLAYPEPVDTEAAFGFTPRRKP